MNTTQTISLIAARASRGDSLSLDQGETFRTVDEIAIVDNTVAIQFTDGTTAKVAPHRYVEVA